MLFRTRMLVAATLATLILAASSAYAAGAPSLLRAPFLSSAAGGSPISAQLADLDGDGHLDVVAVVTGNAGDSIAVMLGSGDGRFGPGPRFPLTQRPTGVVFLDLNHDGRPDVVTLDGYTSNVSVFLGMDHAQFAPPVDYPIGYSSYAIAAGDVDGDGLPDLVIPGGGGSTFGPGQVAILHGDGAGGFTQTPPVTIPGFGTSVAIGDLDGDTHADLAVTYNGFNSDLVGVLRGNGHGGFSLQASYLVGFYSTAIALGDFDGDHVLDVAVSSEPLLAEAISIFYGNGDGTLGPRADIPIGGTYAPFILALDLDHDGRADLAVANASGSGNPIPGATVVTILGSRPGRTFAPAENIDTGLGPATLARGDVDEDGNLDLVVANSRSNTIASLLGSSGGHFGPADIALGRGPVALAVADLNHDGRPDMAAVDDYSVALLIARADGSFGVPVRVAVGAKPAGVAIADLNGDHDPDLLVSTNELTGRVVVLLGMGNGSFGPGVSYSAGFNPTGIIVADLNGDARPDVIVPTQYGRVSILLNNGDGTLGPRTDVIIGSQPVIGAYQVAAGDLNGDGRVDLVVAGGGEVFLMFGDGTGAILPTQTYVLAPQVAGIAIADMNHDGIPDLVESNSGTYLTDPSQVTILLGHGGANFGAPAGFRCGPTPYGVAVADLDVDGALDVVTVNYASNTVSVLRGDGSGALLPRLDFGTGTYPSALVLADMNGDASPDVITANLNSQSLSVLLSTAQVATPTLLSLVSANADPGRVFLHWFTANRLAPTATVFRRSPDHDWLAIGEVFADGTGSLFYEDAQVTPGGRYGYRLGVSQNGREEFLGEVWVDVPSGAAFGLAGARPNPVARDLRVAFSLPDGAPARLDLMDLAGRRLAGREVGTLGPGNHLVDLAQDRTLAPGVYLLRLTRGGRALSSRAVVVR
jgi:hypothetical protein